MANTSLINDVLARLSQWAQAVSTEIGTEGIYLFGSLIHRDGEQFSEYSDIDLLIIIPSTIKDATERVDWLEQLLTYKKRFELELFDVLMRPDVDKPICSFVAPTILEVAANIHKDGAVDFFAANAFRDLLNTGERRGLLGAGEKRIDARLVIECLRFAQKKRNEFLSIDANGPAGMPPYNDGDPLPKDIMRHGAMARQLEDPIDAAGAEYDTQRGLDFLTNTLYQVQQRNSAYEDLHDRISVRRGARGNASELSPKDQMLLTEIIYDVAVGHLAATERRLAESLPSMGGRDSTVFFAERFAQAFPGVRGIEWYSETETVGTRLETLLGQPLIYSDGAPIWWWRHGNFHIETFRRLGDGVYLMNVDELQIRKIAAVNPGPYYREFVYVETEEMPPTGLYESTDAGIAENKCGKGFFGYYWEEYGIVDGVHLINRAQFDDGAAMINGRLEDVRGRTELRSRYVTSYNFIIAANGSPINNGDFDERLAQLLNSILGGQAELEELANEIYRLPKRGH